MEALDTAAAGGIAVGDPRVAEWLREGRDKKVELLDGRQVRVMPSIAHGAAVGLIFSALADFGGPPMADRRGGWWLSMDVDLFVGGQGLRPDLVGWRIDKHPQVPRKVNIDSHLGVYVTPPDWVCEVLSDSTSYRDVRGGVKWEAYYQAEVAHYWTVDLSNEVLMVFERGPRRYELAAVLGREDVKALPPFESIEFDARRLFALVASMRR